MVSFINQHSERIVGILHGFDRMRFQGTQRLLSYNQGVMVFLAGAGLMFKDFKDMAKGMTDRLVKHTEQMAQTLGRPSIYLARADRPKEQLAADIAERDGITEGLICVLRCPENCRTVAIRRLSNGAIKFVSVAGRCTHLYFYFMDREFGLMHVRVQSWLPFGIQIGLNGREFLARQMAAAGIGFEQRDNCFTRIDDLPRAQAMLDELTDRKWERLLGALARRVNPLLGGAVGLDSYYWTLKQSEYATDVMFKDARSLAQIYPSLIDHGIKRLSSQDVLRFLGAVRPGAFAGQASASLMTRQDGVRIKHWVEGNSIKMYDKQGSVLRIETTINNVRRFRVRRMASHKGQRCMRWVPMRFGLADIQRRVEVSCAANKRYLEALGSAQIRCPARTVIDRVQRRITRQHRPYRALGALAPQDVELFAGLMDGKNIVRGITNRSVRGALGLPCPKDPVQRKKQSAKITRKLRLCRAHGLIAKVPGTRYYRVTPTGHRIMSACLQLREADLTTIAA